MSKIVDIVFLQRKQLCAIVLKKEMNVIHFQASICNEKNLSWWFFFLEYVENGEFIAEKIWKPEGFSKILTTATGTCDRPWYPEKTLHVDLHFWFLSRSFFCAKFWKTLKNNFLSKCGNRFSLKNGEFIARKIWASSNFLKSLAMPSRWMRS